MHSPSRIALVALCVSVFVACEQAPKSVLGPTASVIAAPTSHLEVSLSDEYGALPQRLVASRASQESDFGCRLGPFGIADQSHATRAASGNEILVCQGEADATFVLPDKAEIIEGFACALHFDGTITTDSRLVLTPSGHVTLTCRAKN